MSIAAFKEVIDKLAELEAWDALKDLYRIEKNPVRKSIIKWAAIS